MSETHPKPVRQFVEGIEALFPNAEITLERGGKTSGVWWIDIAAPQAYVVVNWSQAKGFSLEEVTDEELVYGSLPAERYQTVDIALKRMTQLLAEETAAGAGGVALRELRELHGLSQSELGIKQAAVS